MECPTCGNELTIEFTKFFEIHICEHCFLHTEIIPIKPCCRKPDFHKVRYTSSNNAIHVREQCRNCGLVTSESIGGYNKMEKDRLPGADMVKKNLADTAHGKCWKWLSERRQSGYDALKENYDTYWWQQYKTYLQTSSWKDKRLLALKRDNNTCQCCMLRPATEVHHETYRYVDFKGGEPLFDLISMCEECHDTLHEMKNKKEYRPQSQI